MHCTDTASTPTRPRAGMRARVRGVAALLGLCALAACNALHGPAQSMADYKRAAAQRIVAANPAITYMSASPDPLLAIPVLEIEVNGDGSIRHITVMRVPSQAEDTVKIAIDAVRRAAPFGDATHLPRPWKFTEVFLFDENRRFKPRTLD